MSISVKSWPSLLKLQSYFQITRRIVYHFNFANFISWVPINVFDNIFNTCSVGTSYETIYVVSFKWSVHFLDFCNKLLGNLSIWKSISRFIISGKNSFWRSSNSLQILLLFLMLVFLYVIPNIKLLCLFWSLSSNHQTI